MTLTQEDIDLARRVTGRTKYYEDDTPDLKTQIIEENPEQAKVWQEKGEITPYEAALDASREFNGTYDKVIQRKQTNPEMNAMDKAVSKFLGDNLPSVKKTLKKFLNEEIVNGYNTQSAIDEAHRQADLNARSQDVNFKDYTRRYEISSIDRAGKANYREVDLLDKIGFLEAMREGTIRGTAFGALAEGADDKKLREIKSKICESKDIYQDELDFLNRHYDKEREKIVRGYSLLGKVGSAAGMSLGISADILAGSFLGELFGLSKIASGAGVNAYKGLRSIDAGKTLSRTVATTANWGVKSLGGAGITTVANAPYRLYAEYQGRMLNNETELTDSGNLIFKESDETPASAFFKSLSKLYIMYFTEIGGGEALGTIVNGLGKGVKYVASPIIENLSKKYPKLEPFILKTSDAFAKRFEELNNLPIIGKSTDWLKSQAHFDGFLKECGEEALEDVLNLTVGTNNEERTLENYAKAVFKTPEEWAIIAGAIIIQGAGLSAANYIIAKNMAKNGSTKEEIEETINSISQNQASEIIDDLIKNKDINLSFDELSLSNRITQNIKEEIKSKAVQNGVSEELGEKASNLLTNMLAVRADDNDRDITELYEETAPNIVFSDDDVILKGGVRQDTVLNQPMNNNVENEFGQTQEELAEMFKADIQNIMEENNVEADEFDIEDVRIYGSYTTGKNKDTSDLDVIVQYSGTMKEDAAFNLLHDTELTITDKNGVERVVDINPINRETSGTIDEHIQYMNNLNNAKNYNSFEDFVNEFSEHMEETPEDYKINNLQDVLNDLGITEDTPLVVNTPTGTVSVRVSSIEHIVNGGDSTLHNPDKSRYKSINRMLAVLERPEIVISDENGKKKYIKLFKGNNKTKSQIAVVYNDVNGDYVYTTIPVTKHKKYILKEVNSGNVIYKKGQTRENIPAANNIITDNSENFNPDVLFQAVNIAGAESNELEDAAQEWQEKGTDSKYFKKWFGNSKVVDENGKPLIVYHGSLSNDIQEFDKFFIKNEDAFFFTDNKNVAIDYAKEYEEDKIHISGKVYPVYLNIQNPYIVDAKGKTYSEYYSQLQNDFSGLSELGYDGLIIKNFKDNKWNNTIPELSTVYAVFNSSQIKSVDNRGTFDSENANIYYQPEFVSSEQLSVYPDVNAMREAKAKGAYIPVKNLIQLFKNADESTIVHELGHWYLQCLVEDAQYSEKAKTKLDAVRSFLKNNGEEFSNAQQEKFARGFEAYVRSGYARTNRLKKVFEDFKNALLNIYDDIKDMFWYENGVEQHFTDEDLKRINPLFERLMSTENERIQATVFKRVADINEQKQEIKKHQVNELYELEEMTQNNIEAQQQKERNKELKQYYLDLADKMTSREPKAVKEYKKRYKDVTLQILESATGKDKKFVANPKNYEKIRKLIETTDKISSGIGFLPEWFEFYSDAKIGNEVGADAELAHQALDNLINNSFMPLDYQEDEIDIFYKRFNYLLDKLKDVKGSEKDAVFDAIFDMFDTMPQMPDYFIKDVVGRLEQAGDYLEEKKESIAKRYTALSLTQQYRMYIADKLSKTKIYDPVQKKQIRIGEINKLYRLIENTTTLLEAQNAVRAINEYLINQLEYRQKAILHKEIQKQININSKAIKVGALRKGKYDWRTNTIFQELEEINRQKPEELQKQLNIIAQTDKMAENEERENVNENTVVSSMPVPQNEREKIKLEFTEYKSKKLNELNVAHTSKLLADILRLKFEGRRAKDEQEFYRNLETFKTKTNIADVITKKLSNNKVAQYLARWVGGDTLFTSEGTLANWESLLNAIADKETAQEFSLLYDEAQAEVYANNKMLELQNIIAKTYGFEKSEGAKKFWNKMLDFNEMQQVINLFKQYDKEFVTLKVASYNKHTGEISYSDLEVTRSQNMMFYGWAQNKQLRERLVNMFGENQLQYMFSFLSAQDKKLMFNLMDFCDSMYEDTNEVFINITGLSLPKVENYLPSKAERTLSDLDMLQEGIQNSSVSNFSATKDRKNCSKIRMKAVTPLEVIIPHINKTARYVVLAEKLTNFRKIFVDAPEIKDALKNVFKKNTVTNNLPINYDYIHFEGDKSKVIDLKMNKDIKVDSIKPVEVLPFLPFVLHDKPSENKHEIINALELTEGKQRKRTNNNTNETVIVDFDTIDKSASNVKRNSPYYSDFLKILFNVEELFETSQKIISHKSYKGDADLKIDRYANIARIDNNEYLLEFVVKNGDKVELYSVNPVETSQKETVPTKRLVGDNHSTLDTANNSITYIQNLFKSRLVERYNEDYKEEQKRLKENKNKGKKQEKDKGIVTAEKLYKVLINQLSTSTFDNYAKSICVSKNIYDYIANNWISASVGGNLKVLISQLTSVINYSENMPVNEWSDGFRKAILNPKETINYMLDNCDYLKSRLAGNSQNEIMSQLTNEADRFRTLRNFATVNTRYGDIAAIVFGGKPYVDYLINKKGLSKEDAFKRFVESTLRSQQSGHNSATSAWQKEVSRNWLTRMFFAFNNTNMQYERKFIDSVSQFSKGDITKEEFLKVFLIYKVFNPILFTSIIGELSLFHLIRGIFGGDDDELKKGELSMLFASLLSNWGGYGFTGKIANSIAKITIAKKMNDKYFDSDVPLLGTVEDITKKLFKKDGLGFADYIDILASAADYATPIPTSRALTILGGVGDMFKGEIGTGALELLGYGNYRATVGATGKEPKRR